MEKVFKGFKGEDVRPVTSCKFLPHLQSQGTALWGRGYIPLPKNVCLGGYLPL